MFKPVEQLSLTPHETHVWWLQLEQPFDIPSYQANLAKDELARAERFHFAADKLCYILSRGTLRYLLAHYLLVNPDSLVLEYNQYGKPAVCMQQNFSNLQFNYSHSAQMACFAFTRNNAVGIDIEYHKESVDYLGIAKRYFAKAELDQLVDQSPLEQKKIFYKLWTCKEAVIKAVGKGLFLGLDKFSVDLKTLCVNSAEKELKYIKCFLPTIRQIDNYSVAVAGDRLSTNVRIFHCNKLL